MKKSVLHVNFRLLGHSNDRIPELAEMQVIEQSDRNPIRGNNMIIAEHPVKNFQVVSCSFLEVSLVKSAPILFVRGSENDDDDTVYSDTFQVNKRNYLQIEEFLGLFDEAMLSEGYRRVLNNKMGSMEFRYEK